MRGLNVLIVCAAIAPAFPALAQQGAPQGASNWESLPRMVLERQFAGPLRDTIVQRWRDPVDGAICYLYLPITATHTPPAQSGYVAYGSNTIGSISCMPAPAAPRPAAQAPAAQSPIPLAPKK